MGLMRWLRGGDENSATANAMGAGMAELDALFRPSKHKQTEHIQESRRRRVDINNGAGTDVDLDSGIAIIRRRDHTADDAAAANGATAEAAPAHDVTAAPAPVAGVDAAPAPRRRHAPITRRGASVLPATLTVSAAAVEPGD